MSGGDELASDLDHLERVSVTEPRADIAAAATRLYTRASRALDAASGERVRREAAHVAGRSAALAGDASFGVGDLRSARSWFTRARHQASIVGDVDTMAWVYAREAAAAFYYTGYPLEVADLVDRGLALLPEHHRNRHPAASLLLLRAGEVYARDGHDREARYAVDAAERIDPGPSGSQLRLGSGEQTEVAARVFTELGDITAADDRHRAAGSEQRPAIPRALLGLDRGRCLARARQPDAAAVVGLDTWSKLPRSLRSVHTRHAARKLSLELAPWRGQRHVDNYRDLIAGGM